MLQKYLFVILFVISLCSCFSYKSVEFLKIEDIKIKNVKNDGIEATIEAKVRNPNNYSIKVRSTDLKVAINGNNIGKADLIRPLKIKKNSTEIYTADIKINFVDLGAGALLSLPSLMAKKTLDIGLEGTIKGRVGIVSKKVPINLKQNVNMNKQK